MVEMVINVFISIGPIKYVTWFKGSSINDVILVGEGRGY